MQWYVSQLSSCQNISRTIRTGSGPVKTKDGMFLSKGKNKLARWPEHFMEVFNRPQLILDSPAETKDPPHMLSFDMDDFSVDETRRAIKRLKNKSPGFNGILAEMLKVGGTVSHMHVWPLQSSMELWHYPTELEIWWTDVHPKEGNLCRMWQL